MPGEIPEPGSTAEMLHGPIDPEAVAAYDQRPDSTEAPLDVAASLADELEPVIVDANAPPIKDTQRYELESVAVGDRASIDPVVEADGSAEVTLGPEAPKLEAVSWGGRVVVEAVDQGQTSEQ